MQRQLDYEEGKKINPLYEFTAITRLGKRINCETSVTYIKYKDGIATQGIIRDRSEEKKALAALSNSEQSYRELFNNAEDAISIQNSEGKFIRVNKQFENMYGYDSSFYLNKSIEFLTDPGKVDLEFLNTCFSSALKGIPQSFEFYGIRQDGEVFPQFARLHKANYFGKDVVITFSQDVTKQKQAEKELSNLAAFANLNPSPVLRFDKDGIINYANSVTYIIFNRNDILGIHISEILPFFKQINLREYIYTAKINNFELNVCGLDFVFCVQGVTELEMAHIYGNEISDRKRVEKKLIGALEKAESSDQLKSEFLAQMSHEIRTPINTILSFTSLIRDELEFKIDEDLSYSFLSIANAGRRIIRTIDLLLNMSEIQTGSFDFKPRKLDLKNDVFGYLLDEYQILAKEKGLDFSIIYADEPINIYADEYATQQIFANLIDNAIKYTPNGEVVISYSNSIEKVTVKISDTGIGISEEYLPHLFEQFSQEDRGYTRKFEGNGLGLALVKNYCEMNNAEISVSSDKGKGTTFTISFPYMNLRTFS